MSDENELPDLEPLTPPTTNVEETPEPRTPWRQRRSVRIAGVAFALFLVWVLFACIYWSRMPRQMDVHANALIRATENKQILKDGELPPGYVTVSTLMDLCEYLVDKPGGFMSNDRISPARLIDNMRNWEYGAIIQVRDTVHSFRNEFSRARAQSPERQELVEAEARFNINHRAWVMPSSESNYREGITHLNTYLQAVSDPVLQGESFVARQDVLDGWLHRQQRRLGSLSVRLRSNVGTYQFNPHILVSSELEGMGDEILSEEKITPFLQRDDVFYEARGSIYVLYHMMLAIRYDYVGVLDNAQALGTMNRVLSELYDACAPMTSPMVLNGKEFGMVPNHSLTLAAHLAKAHLAIGDLRLLLRGGSDN
jgi:hypothetical protein